MKNMFALVYLRDGKRGLVFLNLFLPLQRFYDGVQKQIVHGPMHIKAIIMIKLFM